MRTASIWVTLGLFTATATAAEEALSIPIAATHERLVIALTSGTITVTPGGEDALMMSADCDQPEADPSPAPGTFRSLRSSRTLPNTVVGDDTISIRTTGNAPRCDITLTAPPTLDLHTRISGSGAIRIADWQSSVLAWSADGDVSVTDHSGSLSVTAMNGDATVSLAPAGIDGDSAITAANGVLTVSIGDATVPAIRAQARWGEIQTNLEVEFDEVVGTGGNWFVSRQTGDGPILTLRNLNANIVIRRSGD